jgi:quercetin dioxygenase-like cupin family protein
MVVRIRRSVYRIRGILGRGVICAGLAASSAVILSASAIAGECPADQVKADAMKPGDLPKTGVTDTVLASIDLAGESIMAEDRTMRLRRLVIEPGGVVPWHSHDDRPALIYIMEGHIIEYRNTCAVPIEHKVGEVAPEVRGTSHWWKNTGDDTVVLIVSDILHDPKDDNM